MSEPDPFGLGDLRAATLSGWRSSRTRYLEDAVAEQDLVTIGYRDRLFTELVANAADAAAMAGSPGRVAIWSDGQVLHVANTGAPLSVEGVRSLLSLRVSAKSDSVGASSVGRFGVGFTAAATVADRVEVRSTTGSVLFDRARTAQVVAEIGADAAARHRPDGPRPPLLRLGWPTATAPAAGYDTEIVLDLRDDIDAEPMVSSARAQAVDLLLELAGLGQIEFADTTFTIDRNVGDAERAQHLTIHAVASDGTESMHWVQAASGGTRWLVEVDSAGHLAERRSALRAGVLRAPTPTDIELSVPAVCITDVPLTPDRRHLHPDADIASAAMGYAELMAALPPAGRPLLIPVPARTRNRDDAILTEAVIEHLRDAAWLPGASGGDLIPSRSVVVADLTTELADVLAPLMGDLAHPDVSERRLIGRLQSVGVTPIGLAELAERLVGTEREMSWWHDLYAALSPLVTTAADAEELGALPIPRSDGRMNFGARGLFVTAGIDTTIGWIPTVDPIARHALIERLGAAAISVSDALAEPALRRLLEEADDEELEVTAVEVFALLAADPDASAPEWLSGLPVPDEEGELRAADELLLPDSPLAAVLVDDAPFGVVSAELVTRVGADVLRRIGVGWGFLTVVDDLPVGPDHDLPDEEQWWETFVEPPESLAAVRDLDLVDPARWAEALTLLVTDDATAPLLADRAGYTAWWLRHHAVIDGRRLGSYRAPSDTSVAGVRDVLDHPHADLLAAALGGIEVETAGDADTLLAHLGDPARAISPGVAASVHAAVVAAVRREVFESTELTVPQRVRTASGAAVERALVLDRPWLIQVLGPVETAVCGTAADADDALVLADVLDLATASEELQTQVRGEGDPATWTCTEAVLFATLWGRDVGHGEIRLHDDLWVRVRRNGTDRGVVVQWWVDDRGITHLPRRSPS